MTIESEIETVTFDGGADFGIQGSAVSYLKGRTLRAYDGDLLLASTAHFRIGVKARTVRMVKKRTHLANVN